jgi:hypothetical protein
VNRPTSSEIFPPDFPSELAGGAFTTGKEAAWPLEQAASVVEWLGAHGYAVLGIELWLIQSGRIQSLPIGGSGMREAHGDKVDRQNAEPWKEFVARATTKTLKYLRLFDKEIVEPGEVYFNVTWAGESKHGEVE